MYAARENRRAFPTSPFVGRGGPIGQLPRRAQFALGRRLEKRRLAGAARLRYIHPMLFTVSSEQIERLVPDQLSDELEKGQVVHFATCPFRLPEEADLRFLRTDIAQHLLRKNVSYYPDANRLTGIKADPTVIGRALLILKTYSESVQTFLQAAIPSFMRGARLGTSSFRPLQEHGRNLKPHASNELVHIDAGAYGATHGDRILRFFTNVNPTEDRVWISKGSFTDLYRRHAKLAGIDAEARVGVEEKWVDRAYSGLVRAASKVVPLAKVIDSSPYDRTMRKFHNYMKDTPQFQHDADGQLQMIFKPFSSWMVLTDAVSHACISGQHAFVDTFLVPLANCRLRQLAPYEILRASASFAAVERK
jgi:hypothetical protein